MRMYRILWIERTARYMLYLSLAVYFASLMKLVEAVWSWYAVYTSWVCFGVLMAFHWGLKLLVGSTYQYPTSDEGVPVPPSGIWVTEDERLDVGSPVLAEWQGYWWRGVVVECVSAHRVIVHYLGWHDVWNEPHTCSQLQVDVYAEQEALFDEQERQSGLGY